MRSTQRDRVSERSIYGCRCIALSEDLVNRLCVRYSANQFRQSLPVPWMLTASDTPRGLPCSRPAVQECYDNLIS